jgi:hypothetical protein
MIPRNILIDFDKDNTISIDNTKICFREIPNKSPLKLTSHRMSLIKIESNGDVKKDWINLHFEGPLKVEGAGPTLEIYMADQLLIERINARRQREREEAKLKKSNFVILNPELMDSTDILSNFTDPVNILGLYFQPSNGLSINKIKFNINTDAEILSASFELYAFGGFEMCVFISKTI